MTNLTGTESRVLDARYLRLALYSLQLWGAGYFELELAYFTAVALSLVKLIRCAPTLVTTKAATQLSSLQALHL